MKHLITGIATKGITYAQWDYLKKRKERKDRRNI